MAKKPVPQETVVYTFSGADVNKKLRAKIDQMTASVRTRVDKHSRQRVIVTNPKDEIIAEVPLAVSLVGLTMDFPALALVAIITVALVTFKELKVEIVEIAAEDAGKKQAA